MNGMDSMKSEDPSIYVLCCLISNLEAFRSLYLYYIYTVFIISDKEQGFKVFEALLLIKKMLIKNWVYSDNRSSNPSNVNAADRSSASVTPPPPPNMNIQSAVIKCK